MTAKFELNSVSIPLGLKKPAEGFHNLGRGAEDIPVQPKSFVIQSYWALASARPMRDMASLRIACEVAKFRRT